jgi:hypothetical protein
MYVIIAGVPVDPSGSRVLGETGTSVAAFWARIRRPGMRPSI